MGGLVSRTVAFAGIASAWMTLWPVVARSRLGVHEAVFGLLFALVGAGAAIGTLATSHILL